MRTYKKKGNRVSYTHDQLLAAVDRVRKGAYLKDVSAATGIPIRSIRRQKKQGGGPRTNWRTTFTEEQEAQLRNYINACSNRFYGLSIDEARKLAAEFAEANKINVPPSWKTNGMAGKDWLISFRRRNNLSLRSPEATSMARANGFNRKAVDVFFSNLTTLMNSHNFAPGRILNLDESGITNVAVCPKVLAPTERKQVGQITAAERGTLVTVVGCITNDGNAIPPVLLFPRLRVSPARLGHGSPPGALTLNSPSGWMTTDIFINSILPHIVNCTKASNEDPFSFCWIIIPVTFRWRPSASAELTGSICSLFRPIALTGYSLWTSQCMGP